MKKNIKENKTTFNFGKIDFYGIGRKINAVEVEVNLKEYADSTYGFTVSGYIYNARHTDIIMGGQCLDDEAFVKLSAENKLLKELIRLWKAYHLNNLHAGTYEQEKALNKVNLRGAIDYDKACDYLKSIGLYKVEYKGKPYRYGSGWINYLIPQDDLEKIYQLFSHTQPYLERTL